MSRSWIKECEIKPENNFECQCCCCGLVDSNFTSTKSKIRHLFHYFLILGVNVLFAALLGPKGPCDEVFVKHMGGNQYTVAYQLNEKGEYGLIIKWGDDHIPGSPFKVICS